MGTGRGAASRGADVVKARQTLEHAEGAVPIRHEGVEQTA